MNDTYGHLDQPSYGSIPLPHDPALAYLKERIGVWSPFSKSLVGRMDAVPSHLSAFLPLDINEDHLLDFYRGLWPAPDPNAVVSWLFAELETRRGDDDGVGVSFDYVSTDPEPGSVVCGEYRYPLLPLKGATIEQLEIMMLDQAPPSYGCIGRSARLIAAVGQERVEPELLAEVARTATHIYHWAYDWDSIVLWVAQERPV